MVIAMRFWVYIVRCRDGSYYTGSHGGTQLQDRVDQHNNGTYTGYTFYRRPVELLWSQEFQYVTDAIRFERQIKGWSRKKKEALFCGEIELLIDLASRAKNKPSS